MAHAHGVAKVRNRTQATPAQVRLRAIRAQLKACSTMCEVANADLARGRADDAHKLKDRLSHSLESVRRRLDQPQYVPPESVSCISEELAALERRLREIEAWLAQPDDAKADAVQPFR